MNRLNRRELLKVSPLAFFSCAAWAETKKGRPKQIYLIRHAEKNLDKSDIHLNARGNRRAAALSKLFPERFETPEALFASRQSEHSNRPVETITPLSAALHLKIEHRYANEEFPLLAKDLLVNYAGKTVLVCWHHGKLPALADALGVRNAPSPWPDGQFDRLWRIRFAGEVVMEDLPQLLLDGDSGDERRARFDSDPRPSPFQAWLSAANVVEPSRR